MKLVLPSGNTKEASCFFTSFSCSVSLDAWGLLWQLLTAARAGQIGAAPTLRERSLGSGAELSDTLAVFTSPRLNSKGTCGNVEIVTVKQIFDLVSFLCSPLTL